MSGLSLNELSTAFTIIEDEREEPASCGGLFYRVCRESWVMPSDGSVCFRHRFRPLVKRSCTGCNTCDWLSDELLEYVSDYGWFGWPEELEKMEHGNVVEFKVTGTSVDWETGHTDDIYFDFVKVEEE